jgi:hypothetical protein
MASYYKNMSASGLVKEGPGKLTGIIVASTSSGTLKFWDQTSAAAPILINTFTPAAATFYKLPDVMFTRGLFVTLANTMDWTIFYE